MAYDWVRRLLRREGLSAPRVRTWKTSTDPAWDRKKKRIRALDRRCLPHSAVVCFDEGGPLELQPMGGITWAREKRPQRIRATYRRLKGTEQFLGCYDVQADGLNGVFRRRKRIREVSEAFRRLRRCCPHKRLFVVLDNLHNVYNRSRFLALFRRLRIHPVCTPTEASWINLIEAQFGALKRFTVAHTDDPSHAARQQRIYRYLRYRHRKLQNLHHPLHRIRSVTPIKLE